jgi:hypothetical protein
MATIGATFYDLIDRFSRTDKQGLQVSKIIEILAQENAILADALAVECNQGYSHKTTIRTGLPAVTWGAMYQGIPQSKSTTQQVEDTTGFLEGLSTIDTRLLDISDNAKAERLSEAEAFLEAFSQEMASQLIYGNVETDPEKFTGFAPRFASLSAGNGGQIVDAGGSGSDNTSIWMVQWGGRGSTMLYPKGTRAGVKREDCGKQRVLDGSGNPYYVMEEKFTWHAGLSVQDWRRVVRIANIDVSDLQAGSVDIYKFLRQGFWKWKKHRVRSEGAKMAIYCNSDVLEALDADTTPTSSTTASYVRLKPTEVDGQEVMGYRGIPVRQVDAILNTEAQVT